MFVYLSVLTLWDGNRHMLHMLLFAYVEILSPDLSEIYDKKWSKVEVPWSTVYYEDIESIQMFLLIACTYL